MKALLRRVPGVRNAKRLAVRAYRLMHPLRPPVESPSLVAEMLVRPADDTFITGNGFADRCRYILNYDVFRVNEDVENNWWFCNPEFLDYFFRCLAPGDDFVLFTHNSNVDRPIGSRFEGKLRQPELVAWFATNVELRHQKLHSIPLGIGNPIKCDTAVLELARDEAPAKTRLFEASFDIRTNVEERSYCIKETGILPTAKLPPGDYFRHLASAYFCVSPNGNGIDCYRTWQALYLRTIPIVTRSLLTDQHPDLPMIVLRDWSEFRSIAFSPDLYERTWRDWDPAEISLDRYLERVRATIGQLQDGSRQSVAPPSLAAERQDPRAARG